MSKTAKFLRSIRQTVFVKETAYALSEPHRFRHWSGSEVLTSVILVKTRFGSDEDDYDDDIEDNEFTYVYAEIDKRLGGTVNLYGASGVVASDEEALGWLGYTIVRPGGGSDG